MGRAEQGKPGRGRGPGVARIVERRLEVITGAGGRPERFRWHKRWYRVTGVPDFWRETGRWWAGESEKTFLRVCTADGGTFELYREAGSGNWYLYKIYD